MGLSKRETTIAERYGTGETYKEIAANLGIAPATVRNHLSSIYRKLGVGNKAELIRALSAHRCEFGALPAPATPARSDSVLTNLSAFDRALVVGPSIAVMPFENIGPEERAYVGYGITADIQHELTRSEDLFVAGRSSCLALIGNRVDAVSAAHALGVQYVLQGTVRSDRDRFRFTAELVDSGSGMVLWSECYDGKLVDVLGIEADIVNALAASLSLRIQHAEYERRRHLRDDELTGYDWRLRGNRCLEIGGRSNLDAARDCFERALALEPGSAATYAGLSMCYGYECDLLLAANYEDSLRRHMELAKKAVAADEADSRGHYAMSCALMFDGQFEEADWHAQRGIDLNPSEYHNLCTRGYSLMSLGRIDESLSCFSASLRRNPLAPNSCLLAIGLIEYLERNYGQSASALARMTAYQVQRASTLAASCAQVGYRKTAENAVQEFRHLSSDLPVRPSGTDRVVWRVFWQRAYTYLRDGSFDHLLDGIRKAGLPA